MDERSIAERVAGVGKEPGGTSCRTRNEDMPLGPEQTPMVPLGLTEWPEARRTAGLKNQYLGIVVDGEVEVQKVSDATNEFHSNLFGRWRSGDRFRYDDGYIEWTGAVDDESKWAAREWFESRGMPWQRAKHKRSEARTKYLKVEPTKPGSKNHYKITYHDGQEKWVDAMPGRGLPNRREQRMLPRKMDKPSSQRAVNRLDEALKTFKNDGDPKVLQHAVETNEVGLDKEFAKTVNRNFVKKVKENEDISDKVKEGLQVVTDHVNRHRRDSGLKEVADKIFTRIRESELAKRLVEKVKRYMQTGNPADDLTPQETGLIYRQEDYGEVVPLSHRKKLDVEWTNHAEYRSDLRDVESEKVNHAVEERLKGKLPHPDRKKMTMKEPGLGTVVVNYDMTVDPARADVVTVWASDERICRVAARVVAVSIEDSLLEAVMEALRRWVVPRESWGEIGRGRVEVIVGNVIKAVRKANGQDTEDILQTVVQEMLIPGNKMVEILRRAGWPKVMDGPLNSVLFNQAKWTSQALSRKKRLDDVSMDDVDIEMDDFQEKGVRDEVGEG